MPPTDDGTILAPPVDTQSTEPIPEVTSPIQAFIDSLTQTFESAMGALENSLNSASALPELSPANGQGVAYNKFLAIYNDLQNPMNKTETV